MTNEPVPYTLQPIGIEDFPFRYGVYVATIKPYIDRLFGWTAEEHERFIREDLENKRSHHAIVVDGARAGIVQVEEDDDRISLSQIELLPEFQGRGIGTALVRSLLDRSAVTGKPVELHVFHDNTVARRLYERLGFRVAGETERDLQMVYTPPGTPVR